MRPAPRRVRPVLALALLCHLFFASGYLLLTPTFEGPDENDHYAYAWHLANAGTLPVGRGQAAATGRSPLDEVGPAHHPPAYYALLAATLGVVGRADTVPVTLLNPGFGATGENLHFLHGGDELPPTSGGHRLLLALRGWSLLFGLVSILLVHRLGRVCSPDPAIADSAALLVACLPMWSFLHGVLNNDTLVILLAQASLLVLATVVCDRRLGGRRAGVLGILLGLAMITKLSALALVVLAAGVLVWLRSWPPRRSIWRDTLIVIAGVALLSGWVLWRNVALYGDPFAAASHRAAFAAAAVPDGQVWTWLWEGFFPSLLRSLLGTFGWFRLPPPEWLLPLGALLALIALAGLLQAMREGGLPRAFPLLGAAILLVFALVLRFNIEFRQPQARLLFPAIGPAAVLFAAGLHRASAGLRARLWLGWLVLLPPAIGAAVLFGHFAPAFAIERARAPRHHASLVGGIVGEPSGQRDPGSILRLELAGGEAGTAPTIRWQPPAAAPPRPYSLYVYDEGHRVWIATWEWARLDLPPAEFPLPASAWQLLPSDRQLFVRLRGVPDWRAGERLDTMPVSAPVPFRKP